GGHRDTAGWNTASRGGTGTPWWRRRQGGAPTPLTPHSVGRHGGSRLTPTIGAAVPVWPRRTRRRRGSRHDAGRRVRAAVAAPRPPPRGSARRAAGGHVRRVATRRERWGAAAGPRRPPRRARSTTRSRCPI